MKLRMTYWVDYVRGRVEEREIELKPFGYRMAPITQWKCLVAMEDKEVKKGEPVVLKVRVFNLPENTMVGPLNIMRHAYGTVIDIVECGIPTKVEEEKCINQVLFLPIEDGSIKEGDLIGVLKVFFIKTGLLSRLFGIRPPKVELSEEIIKANITWRDNGNVFRKPMRTEVFGYIRTHIGIWETLVAEEEVDIKAGEIVRVKIREIELPPNTVVVPLSVMRNAYGTVIDVIQLGKPSKVEESKKIHQAIFLPVQNGKIKKGDLIGVINVYYVGVKELKPILIEKYSQKVNLVYEEKGEIKRKEVVIEPFGYKRKPIARWECIVADENKKVKKGMPEIVRIKRIEIPKNTIIYPLAIMRHAYGTVVDVCCDCPIWKVEKGGAIDRAVFLPLMDGEVKEGELLGVINLYSIELNPIEIIRGLYEKLLKMSEEERMAYVEALQ